MNKETLLNLNESEDLRLRAVEAIAINTGKSFRESEKIMDSMMAEAKRKIALQEQFGADMAKKLTSKEIIVDKHKVINLASSIAVQEAELTGKDYFKCLVDGMEESCERLGIDRKGVIPMWMEV